QFKPVALYARFATLACIRVGVALASDARKDDDLSVRALAGLALQVIPRRARTKLYDVCHRSPPNRWPLRCGRWSPDCLPPAHSSSESHKLSAAGVNEPLTAEPRGLEDFAPITG